MDLKRLGQISDSFNLQMPKGVFLSARDEDKDNVMTIGWGSIGVMWGKPVLTVVVRYSRYTAELLKNSDVFTVSVPKAGDMKEELRICGKVSGRDMDKFEKAGLTKAQGRTVNAPVILGCETQFECKILYRQSMEPNLLDGEIDKRHYTDHDYHVFYIGEIVDCY
ncbi:MAG TPA: flavin reductase [Clostridiales bacterium]|nr:flavin reductase [Clostridiales bacterium]